MKLYLMLVSMLMLAFMSAGGFAGQMVEQCLRVTVDGNETYFENICSEEITIAFCSTSMPINGKFCGQQGSDWNPYYTQMFSLDPKKKVYKWKVGKVKYAVCLGFINGWDAKNQFSSDMQGDYTCKN